MSYETNSEHGIESEVLVLPHNASVKWAAECGPQSKQELPAAPLERLVGQGTEKTEQGGIYKQPKSLIGKNFVIQEDTTRDDFKKLFGCKPEVLKDLTIYVDSEGYGPFIADTLKRCGVNVLYLRQKSGGTICFEEA